MSLQMPTEHSLGRLLSPPEIAEYLGVAVATLYQWRARGGGPRGFRVGKHVRYRVEDVDAWLVERRGESP